MNFQTIKMMGVVIALAAVCSHASAGSRDVRVGAFSTVSFSYLADAGELMDVAIRGDGDSDVDLFVSDPSGQRVCSRTGPTDRERCLLTARMEGRYTIRVRNYGDIYNAVHVSVD